MAAESICNKPYTIGLGPHTTVENISREGWKGYWARSTPGVPEVELMDVSWEDLAPGWGPDRLSSCLAICQRADLAWVAQVNSSGLPVDFRALNAGLDDMQTERQYYGTQRRRR